MGTIQQTAAEQWDLALSQLRELVPQAITHLQNLEAAAQACYESYEMGPEEWTEQLVDLEHFMLRDESTGVSPEETIRRAFGLVRSALGAGDQLVNFEEF